MGLRWKVNSSGFLISTAPCAAEDIDFCSLGVGLYRLSAVRPEDVDGEVRPQSVGPVALSEHGD